MEVSKMERKCETCKYFIPKNKLNKEQMRIFNILARTRYINQEDEDNYGLCIKHELSTIVRKDEVCPDWESGNNG